jgi:hypothetical protein
MKRIEFIAALFVLALCCLLVGGMNLYERLEFGLNGQSAQMQLANPVKTLAIEKTDQGIHLIDVRYLSQEGELVVPGKRLWGDEARIVGGGGQVPVTYLKHNPQRVLYRHQELDSPWVWLAVGVGAMATFIYALRLRRREGQ